LTGINRTTMKKATGKKSAAKKAASKSATSAAAKKAPGIGRSAITGRFMSVSAAKGHKRTAIVEGAGKKGK
jgi:hypothetical protein